MLKKKCLLNILAVVIATALLCLTVDIGFIIADETQPTKTKDTPVIGKLTEKILQAMGRLSGNSKTV